MTHNHLAFAFIYVCVTGCIDEGVAEAVEDKVIRFEISLFQVAAEDLGVGARWRGSSALLQIPLIPKFPNLCV